MKTTAEKLHPRPSKVERCSKGFNKPSTGDDEFAGSLVVSLGVSLGISLGVSLRVGLHLC